MRSGRDFGAEDDEPAHLVDAMDEPVEDSSKLREKRARNDPAVAMSARARTRTLAIEMRRETRGFRASLRKARTQYR